LLCVPGKSGILSEMGVLMSECRHQRRRDVESCDVCDAEEERDEARAVAIEFIADLYSATRSHDGLQRIVRLANRYPWLRAALHRPENPK
jgi:hypothetical protein